jgi:hypothetical protein
VLNEALQRLVRQTQLAGGELPKFRKVAGAEVLDRAPQFRRIAERRAETGCLRLIHDPLGSDLHLDEPGDETRFLGVRQEPIAGLDADRGARSIPEFVAKASSGGTSARS